MKVVLSLLPSATGDPLFPSFVLLSSYARHREAPFSKRDLFSVGSGLPFFFRLVKKGFPLRGTVFYVTFFFAPAKRLGSSFFFSSARFLWLWESILLFSPCESCPMRQPHFLSLRFFPSLSGPQDEVTSLFFFPLDQRAFSRRLKDGHRGRALLLFLFYEPFFFLGRRANSTFSFFFHPSVSLQRFSFLCLRRPPDHGCFFLL